MSWFQIIFTSIESGWLMYLILVKPFKSLSLNRIVIINQIVFTTSLLASIILKIRMNWDRHDFYNLVTQYVLPFAIQPYSYFLVGLHVIFIKVFFVKKNGMMVRRRRWCRKRRDGSRVKFMLNHDSSEIASTFYQYSNTDM
jgi:hypothetical protein